MMRWRPWPPLPSRKFEVRLLLRRADGLPSPPPRRLAVEIVWKGPRAALRRPSARRNCTREEDPNYSGVAVWDEDFRIACSLAAHRDDVNVFYPWEIAFAVFASSDQGRKHKPAPVGTALLDLAEFVASAREKEIEIVLPLSPPGGSLHLALSLLELRASNASSERSIVPVPCSPPSKDGNCSEKDEFSALKAGLRKVKLLREFVSSRRVKKACREENGSEGRCSDRCDDAEYAYPFDTDSHDDDIEEGEVDDGKSDSFRKSFSYGTLPSANYLGGLFCSDLSMNGEYEDLVYYSHRRSDVACSHIDETRLSIPEQVPLNSLKRSILPWKKRKLSFRSPKAKGEPLLKKTNGEEGGDDIDYDRRQLSSSDESLYAERRKADDDLSANQTSISDFGGDDFAIGNWELKEIISRDGHMKLCSQVFFASIDQRNERAAGAGACTALVVVIADWFQNIKDMMPIKSQFDSLIRDGSLEWRYLCENQTYRERFPDKHFDLETVLQAKVRPLSVVPGKSFIGFFHPEGIEEDSSGFDFLHGAMSFDSIWDEISHAASDCQADGSQIYIVSWNDHFFVLKVECDAYYFIDTLGERLHEGCDQAYILKFDESTSIYHMPSKDKAASCEAAASGNQQVEQNENTKEGITMGQPEDASAVAEEQQKQLICKGKESCKEYIKNFLAAIPVRELQADIKKGLMASTPLHHRLQVEFHYTILTKETKTIEELAEFLKPSESTAFEEPLTSVPSVKLEAEFV